MDDDGGQEDDDEHDDDNDDEDLHRVSLAAEEGRGHEAHAPLGLSRAVKLHDVINA